MNSTLRDHLDRIRIAALEAADPAVAVERHLRIAGEGAEVRLTAGAATWRLADDERIHLLAAGKAAAPMAEKTCQILGPRLAGGLVVRPHGQAHAPALPQSVRLIEAGHPIPDASGLEASREVEAFVRSVPSAGRMIVLLSGGASALLAAPVPGITLEALQSATALLLRSGATIQEVNAIRKHTDRLKGGQMARLANGVPMMALLLSDVIGDRLDVIASGPTVPDPSTFSQCWEILQKYALVGRMPTSVETYLRGGLEGQVPETPKPGDPIFRNVENTIVGSNRLAAEAAVAEATGLGYQAMILTTFAEGEARELGIRAAAIAKGLHHHDAPKPSPACIVIGGETTVTVTGKGKGGRNQELALSAALNLEGVPDTALMAFATDGIDGPTDAAGAMIDGDTVETGRAAGLDAKRCLADNDAYNYLKAAGALIVSGPTSTNVNDLVVILAR